MVRIQIKKGKTKATTDQEPDLRTPSGRLLPY
jgi:hypothetical protein